MHRQMYASIMQVALAPPEELMKQRTSKSHLCIFSTNVLPNDIFGYTVFQGDMKHPQDAFREPADPQYPYTTTLSPEGHSRDI